MQSMNDSACEINRLEMTGEVQRVIDFLLEAYREQEPVHEVERGLWKRMLQLGRQLLGGFFALYGDGDEGEVLHLGEKREVKKLQELQTRGYLSVFGEFEFSRVVYASGEGRKAAAIPFDERLQLPKSKFSYLLQDWDQALEVQMPYAPVSYTHLTLPTICSV